MTSATVARWTWCLRRSLSLARGFFFKQPAERHALEREGEFDPRARRGFHLREDAVAIEGDDGLARADLHVAAELPNLVEDVVEDGPQRGLGPGVLVLDVLLGLLEIDLRVAVPGVLVRGVIDDVPRGVGAEAVLVLQEGDAVLARRRCRSC